MFWPLKLHYQELLIDCQSHEIANFWYIKISHSTSDMNTKQITGPPVFPLEKFPDFPSIFP